MVSWSADGLMSGYSASSHKLVDGVYHFASSGTVDVNAITRLQYTLDKSYSTTTYRNSLKFSAPIAFTNADFVACGTSRWLSVSAFMVADAYVTGTPTPSQILTNPHTIVFRSDIAYKGGNVTGITHTFNIATGAAYTAPNQKLWVLLLPVMLTSLTNTPSTANDKPMITGPAPNTIGRALSFWSNRTPPKPVITSPTTGTVRNPGQTMNFAFTVADPDSVGSDYRDYDLAGIQVQYGNLPTPDNPTVTWTDMDYELIGGQSVPDTNGVKNKTFTIQCGGSDITRTLPGGDWQIRMRVVDYGHPYPNLVRPFGDGPTAGRGMYNAPAVNLSPWSDAVRVSVTTQVPPPILLAPINGVAKAENQTVRLSWQYRNQFSPPYAQLKRWVQIRKVGDTNWSTVFAGAGSAAYVDLPPVLDNPPQVASSEYMADGGFEGSTTDGWAPYDPIGGATSVGAVANLKTDPVHSGSRCLAASAYYQVSGLSLEPYIRKVVSILPGHDTFTFTGWVLPGQSDASFTVDMVFLDGGGSPVAAYEHDVTSVTQLPPTAGWPINQWYNVQLQGTVPPSAVTVWIVIHGVSNSDPALPGLRLDDVSLIGSASTNTDDFALVATTNYEWRVQVMDADGVLSGYTTPANFWVVDAPATNEVRPVPSGSIDGASLGCGSHRVEVYRRGGLVKVGEIRNLSHVDWGRSRDDISTAKIVVSGWDIDCGNLLAELQTWAYEIKIWRNNGFDIDAVWEGPITLLTYEVDKVTIQAKDVMGYAYRRILKQAMNDSAIGGAGGQPVTARAAQVLQNALAPDDPNVLGYLQVITNDTDAMEYRNTPAYSRTAFEEVDDMAANAGLDYTVVGRAVLLWGTKSSIGRLPEFKDNDLGAPPIVSEYGMSMANRYAISDGNGLWGEATHLDVSGNDPTYGLVEMLSSTWASDSTDNSGTYTQEGQATVIASFEEYAERSISDRYPPPVVVRVPDNTTLNPDASISIQQLVPGVVIPLRSTGTLRAVVGLQKLDSVTVTEEDGNETITVTMSPFGGDDTLSAEETV